jgi:Asp-tRNA(Asn)/Glu-tRNA(Gln) amidotransferase A subunit family amidase
MTNISEMGAVELTVRLAQGGISPVEAVSAAIEACERLKPALNVLCSQRFERALDDARAIKPGSAPFAGARL